MENIDEANLTLFDNSMVREKKYWQFIKMIAPPNCSKPIGGWKNKDCIGLYCLKCKTKLKYVMSDSKIIRRHMKLKHAKDLEDFEEAIESLEQALTISPNDYWGWYRQGDAYSYLGQYEEAKSNHYFMFSDFYLICLLVGGFK